MPRNVKLVRFVPDDGTGYLTDRGAEIAANGTFVLPPDLADTVTDTILGAIGANLTAAIGDPVPCSDGNTGDLRKLQFIRSDNSSMSVPVSSRANLVTAANTIIGAINGTVDVVCVKLIGEFFPNLNDELGLAYANTFAQSHVPATGTKQYYVKGTASYSTDATGATASIVPHPIKGISNNDNAPATKFGTSWAGCVGTLTNTPPCPGVGRTNPRDHRRYILYTLSKQDPAEETETAQAEINEIPVSSAVAADILSCGQNLAGLNGAYCIGYRGESYSRFHKVLS